LLQKKSFFEHDDSYKKVLIKCLYSAGKNMDSLSSDPLTPNEIEHLQELWQAQPKTQDKPA
jgi:hypothetical protein